MKSAGIVFIDTWFPETIKKQTDWPAASVEQWRARGGAVTADLEGVVDVVTAGVKKVVAAIAATAHDPFGGCRQIHVIDEKDESSDIEARAVRRVLGHADLQPREVDLLLTHAMVNDAHCTNPGAIVHHKAGLLTSTMAYGVDGVCASFLLQLQIAARAVQCGDARRVVVSQSSACTRLMPADAPFSPLFGDGSSAAVVAAVDDGYGLLGIGTRTWGDMHKSFIATVPGKRWIDEGRVQAWSGDRAALKKMQLLAPDLAKELIDDVLAKAGVAHDEVAFFDCHQPTVWFLPLCQEHVGLAHAKSAPTFADTGTLSNVNVPAQLAAAASSGMLRRGDGVVCLTIAGGMTATAAVLRWSEVGHNASAAAGQISRSPSAGR